ncbi:exopolysaccharide biosynthesis polyprenyl glycosylphosphotransferase [Algibacter sp.]|uniref:exopolysaccharide biosynthesis polyprenyl glycosylphosphotransferase n=1 Tax=Algibacter sp. TaxID=1872428 RepID=UPI003C7203E7
MNSKNRYILIKLLLFEFVLLNLVLTLYLYFRLPEFSFTEPAFLLKMFPISLIYNFGWLFIILYIRDKEFYFDPNYSYFKNILISLFFFVGFVSTLVILFKIRYFARSTFIFPIFIFSYLNLLSHKFLLKFLKKKSANLFSKTLLIGSSLENSNLIGFTKNLDRYGYHLVGYLEDGIEKSKNKLKLNVFGNISEFTNVLNSHPVDEVFIAVSKIEEKKIIELIQIADSFGVRVKLIPENPELLAKKFKTGTIGDYAVYKLRQSPLDNFNKTIVKSLFDFCFAFLCIIILSPIFLIIAVLILLDSKGPVFYTPLRKGESGNSFKCYKFRTMSINDDPLFGTKSTIKNDPRITRIGKLLRKSNLDELPQFFNVLKGEMSVIGPRPHRANLQQDFRKSVNDYMVRSYIKPGITGWAQVNGWRGPTITSEQKNERIKHDLWYIENWSFWLDIKIIFMTIFGRNGKNAF